MILKALSAATAALVIASSAVAVSSGTPTRELVKHYAQHFGTDGNFARTAIAAPHQQNALLIADGYLFVAYHDRHDILCISRRPLSGGSWDEIRFSNITETTGNNGHKSANIAYSPEDNRLHIVWGQHANDLQYMISKNDNATTVPASQWNTSLFKSKRNYLKSGQPQSKVTYPRFVIGKDDDLLLFWRGDGGSGGADSFVATYEGNDTWSSRRRIVDGLSPINYTEEGATSKDRNAYFNDINYRSGRLHISWTWREFTGGQASNLGITKTTNHDLNYAYSINDGITWNNAAGTRVADTRIQNYIDLNSDVLFRDRGYQWGIENQCGQTVDKDGAVHILWRQRDAKNGNKSLFHYRKTESASTFTGRKVSFNSSGRPKIYSDPTNNSKKTLYALYTRNGEVQVRGANKGTNNWGTWQDLLDSDDDLSKSHDYHSVQAVLSDDGRTMYILAHRSKLNNGTPTSSPLELITLPVTP